jgi:hypothetical protein
LPCLGSNSWLVHGRQALYHWATSSVLHLDFNNHEMSGFLGGWFTMVTKDALGCRTRKCSFLFLFFTIGFYLCPSTFACSVSNWLPNSILLQKFPVVSESPCSTWS